MPVPYQSYDLGNVLQTAETIKGMRRQAENDKIRNAYMGQQIETMKSADQARQAEAASQAATISAQRAYHVADAVVRSDNPVGSVQNLAPDFVQEFEKKNGAGSFANLQPDQVRQMFTPVRERAMVEAGIQPQQPKLSAPQTGVVNGKEVVYQLDEQGNPHVVQGVQPAAKVDTSANVNEQLITRPVGDGTVQDFSWNPRTRQRVPVGQPYRPATPQTGNVTEGERKAAALGTRLDLALQEISSVTQQDPGSAKPGVMERAMQSVGSEMGANAVRSTARQRVDSAQLDALDAALTLATGAAYTKEQLQNLRTSYFPQIGDDPATVEAKNRRFMAIVQTARIASGRAEPSIDKAVAMQQPTQDQQQPQRPLSPEEAAKLPPGTQFIGLDGVPRVKH